KGPVSLSRGQMRFEPDDATPILRPAAYSSKKSVQIEEIEGGEEEESGNERSRGSQRGREGQREEMIDPLQGEAEAKFVKYEGPIVSVSETEKRAAEFFETMRSYSFLSSPLRYFSI